MIERLRDTGRHHFGTQAAAPKDLKIIDANELGRHNRQGDAWVAIDSIVYDVSDYEKRHPGGGVLFESAGRDVSGDFYAIHSGRARKELAKLPKVAALKPPAPTNVDVTG